MKYFSIIPKTFWLFLILYPLISKPELFLSIERKYTKLNSIPTLISNYSIRDNSEKNVIYSSDQPGIHFLSLIKGTPLIKKEDIIEIDDKCSEKMLNIIKERNFFDYLIFSSDNWEICLNEPLIKSFSLTYDLSFLMGSKSKAGMNHAFIYYRNENFTFFNISHESNYIGSFNQILDVFFLKTKEKIQKKYNYSRFIQSKASNKLDNSNETNLNSYNLTINSETKWNFTTNENITGSNVIYQNMTVIMPKSSQNTSNYTFSKPEVEDQNKTSLKSSQNPLNYEFPKNEIEKISKNTKNITMIENLNLLLTIGLTSYGLDSSDLEYSSMEINNKLVHASKSCGLHVVIIDPCQGIKDKEKIEEKKTAINNLTNFYNEINEIDNRIMKIIDINCFDTFTSVNVGNLGREIGKLLVICPSMCPFDEKIEIYNPQRIYSFDQEICTTAIENNVIDDRGGTVLIKFIENSLNDEDPFKNLETKALKFQILRYRASKPLLNQKNAINLNISDILIESLRQAENLEEVNESEMEMLENNYDFNEDTLSYLPKFMRMYFSDQKDTIINLELSLREQEYPRYLKTLGNLRAFVNFQQAVRKNKNYKKNIIDFTLDFNTNIEDKVIFSKTFYICKEESQIYESEIFYLKHLLENLNPNWKILITTLGSWISGIDNELVRDLLNLGAPEKLSQYFKEYQEDNSKNDLSMVIIGQINFSSLGNYSKIEKNTRNKDFLALNQKIPSKTYLQTDLTTCCRINKDFFQPKILEKKCSSWLCRFFYSFQQEYLKSIQNISDSSKFLKSFSDNLKDIGLTLQMEQLRVNQLSFSQFLLDLPLTRSTYNITELSCTLSLESNFQEGSLIKYGPALIKKHEILNSILVIILDNSCQRKFITSRVFDYTNQNLISLNKFLQEQEEGSIMAFVQYGYFNWTLISKTSLNEIFQYYGLLDIKDFSTLLNTNNSNLVFIGRKNLKKTGSLAFSINSKAGLEINLCKNELFHHCDSNFLYIRSIGNNGFDSSLDMRVILLNEKTITKNDYRGISLTILGCSEKVLDAGMNEYQKLSEKNYNLWSDGEELKDLNKHLKEMSLRKSYLGTPLFILSSLGNFELYLRDSEKNEDLIEFNSIVEKLGGSSIIAYLKESSKCSINGNYKDIGHPFITVGSPKFKKYSAFEYRFVKNESNYISELMIDLKEKKLTCPNIFKEVKSLEQNDNQKLEYAIKTKKILSDFSFRLDQEIPKLFRYKQPSSYIFKENNNNTNYITDKASDEAIFSLTREYLRNITVNTSNNENNKNNSLFPEDSLIVNPCITIKKHKSPEKSKNIYSKPENITFSIFIRGLIQENSTDKIQNLLINNQSLCSTPLEKYQPDQFSLEPKEINHSIQIQNPPPRIFIYKCNTEKEPPIGNYQTSLLSKKNAVFKDINTKIRKINLKNYEVKLYF